jgi:sugar phosphate isomerase/epimerase
LTGEGQFPLAEIRRVLETINYNGFLSFEWEKKWHPEIEVPEIAIPHFANWFRDEWERFPVDHTVGVRR